MKLVGEVVLIAVSLAFVERVTAGSNDDCCERDEVGTGQISSNAILRLNFAGRFLADAPTYNNDPENYNINKFHALKHPKWNPKGTGDFRLVDCVVTQVCLTDGHCHMDDPAVGRLIIGSNGTAAGKLVDLDADQQYQSQLWGLVVGVDGFFKGDFTPRSFNHLHDACEGPECCTVTEDTRLVAAWISTLQNVEWIEGPLAKRSNFMQQVKSLRCLPGFTLYVKINLRYLIETSDSPDFSFGRVVGTIYAVVSRTPLPYGPYSRMLWKTEGPGEGGHLPLYVDMNKKNVVLDFGNSLNFDIKGNLIQPSGKRLYLIYYNATARRCELVNNESYNLGEIRLGGNDWFRRTAGIVELSVNPQAMEAIGNTPLAVIQEISSTRCEPVLEERSDGLFVEAMDKRIARQEPDTEWTMKFRAFQFGKSAQQVFVRTSLSFPLDRLKPAIEIVNSEPSDNNGISSITFRTTNPGRPRKEKQLDGQVYIYDLIAKIGANGTEFKVHGLNISVLLYSQYTFTPGEVTWYEHVYPIFQQYANLYPVMKPIINLASYEDVTRKRKLLKYSLTLPETDPNYMPVTRNLSPKKREMILSWLDDLDPSSNLPRVGTATATLDELKKTLQIALQLELSTIPPYLSALFSIKDGDNQEVTALIRSVVVDEMKHVALVANLLNAIGGAPYLNIRSTVTSYPSALPGGANPGLLVKLARCSLNQIRTVFQRIERPNCETADSDVIQYLRIHKKRLKEYRNDEHDAEFMDIGEEIGRRCNQTSTRPQTIGAIYIHQILCPMVKLQTQLQAQNKYKNIFTGTRSKQITSDQWLSNVDSSPFAVHDLRSAVAAIVDIASEGEGSDPCDPFDERGEVSHFFTFAEVLHGRRLIETDQSNSSSLGQCFDNFFPCDDEIKCDRSYSFVGRMVPFYEDGVWPTISNPRTESYPPGSLARKYSDNFNKIYTGLLMCIHEAFNGNPDKMKDCTGMTSSLTAWGNKLVQTPIDPAGDPEIGPNAAPTFEFYDPND
ncbi:PREDICTED: LOW QUALITY PROTEIN: uncharacterized protein LOC109469537 [Branchiostoma belcheri]|uniref:LOW QUALITY PROTEIN: uncharacterized protein LOC109469537 n=1 Tax=Branchiostoma belcheri TaxID=7741 RepID=A0A6P4YGR7_BRABE|nr:PREDICTED: LOW QUALITY PROTEIN: uncharacterized protein LOC109469537 [Branchiostoma belcheri]